MVSETAFWAVSGAGGTIVLIIAGAIYHNRRMINAIKIRLFGTGLDQTDDGVLVEMREDIKDLSDQMQREHSQTMDAIRDSDD